MKIFYWSPFFTNIATIKAVTRSAISLKKFSKNYHNVKLIDAINEWEFFQHENIEVVKLNNLNLKKWLPKNNYLKSRISYVLIFLINFFRLKSYLRNEKPDYLIIHLLTSLPIFLSPFINKKTKIILRISGYPKINIIRFIFWKLFSKYLYKVTCPTKKTYELISKKNIFEKNQLEVLYDPIIDINDFNLKKKEELDLNFNNTNYIVSIGRLTAQKNFSLLINFFAHINRNDKRLNLIILGDGEQKNDLKNLVLKFGLENNVHFLGFKNNVFKYLKHAKCFVLTSLWEDPCFVLCEAAMSNIPIIASDCPSGPKEIIGENGFLFKNNNLSSLIDTYNNFELTDSNTIKKKVFFLKRDIKKFTIFKHYKKLKSILK